MSLIFYLKYLYFFGMYIKKYLPGNQKPPSNWKAVNVFRINMISIKADDRSLPSYSASEQTIPTLAVDSMHTI